MNNDIDEEWENYISSNNDDMLCENNKQINENTISFDTIYDISTKNTTSIKTNISSIIPTPSSIYISTKTKIAYLNTQIDLKEIFWKIPIINYSNPTKGVIKKQMKFNSLSIEELSFIQKKLETENYFEEYVITHIDNPTGRIKFKDTRKVSIGISKKDLLRCRSKQKSAFYNCFVLILRMNIQNIFKEFHIKIFNTGKLEIPGVQSEDTFELLLNEIIEILQPYFDISLKYKENTNETVLINSNFNCGFYLNREILYDILKSKYNIQCIYDPCSYPGIQCKFYHNPDVDIQNGCQITEEKKFIYKNVKDISFMIFRTGSVLIVGRCEDDVLYIIYNFIKNILIDEYENIHQTNIVVPNTDNLLKDKRKKLRKRDISVNI